MPMNPYLQDQANAITNTATTNLQRNILPGINAGAMMAGGFGGSRQGIAQANAIGQTNQGITNSLAGLYGNAYEGDQNRSNAAAMQAAQLAAQQNIAGMQNQTTRDLGFGNLDLNRTNAQNQYNLGLGGLGNQRYGMDQNYSLGMGQLGLNSQTANQNFYTAQRGQDLQQLGLGANLAQQGNSGLSQQGQDLWNTGQMQNQAGWNPIQQYLQGLAPFTGLGQTTTQTTPGGSAVGGAIGGALTMAQLLKLLGG